MENGSYASNTVNTEETLRVNFQSRWDNKFKVDQTLKCEQKLINQEVGCTQETLCLPN